ncbi:MAG: hypothetical protein HY075_07710 [Deltaproteobacteria bacterium]|nr:hypothetical protein [Deltaproteobacteria bacterium]
MKKRMMMLFVSVFALTPALLGSAWGIENRGKNGEKQECSLMTAKRFEAQKAVDNVKQELNKAGKTSI